MLWVRGSYRRHPPLALAVTIRQEGSLSFSSEHPPRSIRGRSSRRLAVGNAQTTPFGTRIGGYSRKSTTPRILRFPKPTVRGEAGGRNLCKIMACASMKIIADLVNEVSGGKSKSTQANGNSLRGSVATLQVARDRLAGCSSWPLRFAVYSSGGYPPSIAELKAEGVLDENSKHRPVQYLNNILEQDHRAIKRRVRASQHFVRSGELGVRSPATKRFI
jgi:hypothetical protein